MKRRRALLFTLSVVLVLCAACGVWLHKERQQYALNRQLIAALERNDTKTALVLVNAGADPNTRYDPPPAPTVQLLLNQFLHPTPMPGNDSTTALIMACGSDWKPEHDVGSDQISVEENLPLLQAMLTHGANVHAKTIYQHTALSTAITKYREHTVQLLVQHGADINAPLEGGETPLMLAVQKTTGNIAHLLLSHHANPNVQDAEGETALHYAVNSRSAQAVIPELLAHGATPTLCNKQKETPLQLAQKMHRPNVVRLLKGNK